jgi:hypothetical protein
VDLDPAETEAALADGSGRGGNLHRQMHLSWRVIREAHWNLQCDLFEKVDLLDKLNQMGYRFALICTSC